VFRTGKLIIITLGSVPCACVLVSPLYINRLWIYGCREVVFRLPGGSARACAGCEQKGGGVNTSRWHAVAPRWRRWPQRHTGGGGPARKAAIGSRRRLPPPST